MDALNSAVGVVLLCVAALMVLCLLIPVGLLLRDIWPYVVSVFAALILFGEGYFALGVVSLLAGLFGGGKWLDRKHPP